jgi:AraC-like DNA-binding protein
LFGGQRVVVPQDCLAVHWAAVPHQTIEIADNSSYSLSLKLPLSMLLNSKVPPSFVQDILHGKHFMDEPRTEPCSDLALLTRWEHDLQSHDGKLHEAVILEVEARLIRLAITLEAADSDELAGDTGSRVNTRPVSKAVQMAAFVTEYHSDPIRVADIAEAVELHPKYAMDLFRKTFGMTVVEYVTQQRVWHAQRLLANSSKSILDVAYESGFGSASRFYATFKELVGQSPKTYRRLIRAGKA